MPHLSDFSISALFGTESRDFLRSINTAPKNFVRVNASFGRIAKEHHRGECGVVKGT